MIIKALIISTKLCELEPKIRFIKLLNGPYSLAKTLVPLTNA